MEHSVFSRPEMPHLDAGFLERGFDLALHFLDQVAPAVAGLGDCLAQHGVAPGPQMAEGQFLQLAVGQVQTQPVGDRRVNLQRLRRNARPLFARHVIERAHVVRAIGQLDQDDPHVARHGQQHLAERLGLALFAGVELQLVELGQAIDQFGDGRAEALDQLGLGDAAVLDRVVQQRCHQRLRVELPFGALRCHGDRMGDVGLATGANLAQMGFVGKAVGLADLLDFGRVQVIQAGRERGKARCRRVGGSGAGQDRRRGALALAGGLQHCAHTSNVARPCWKSFRQ